MNWLTEPNVCPGLFYGTPAQDGYLIRLRTPGGLLNHQQGRAIAALVEQWGSNTIQVTNRANLQLRSVHTPPTAANLQTLQSLGLAAQNPEIDHLRNVMTSPTAGIDPAELIDTRPLVQALDHYIQNHPELAELPAKFSIGMDGGGSVGIGTRSEISWEHRYNEIQLSAVWVGHQGGCAADLPGVYFRLALGSDKALRDTQVLIQPNECIPVIAALAKVYLDYGRQAPRSQKKPRMKHLLQDWGTERCLQQMNQQLSQPLHPVTNCPMLPPTQRYAHLGIHSQRQIGLSYIGISLELGQLTAAQLYGLAQLSETFGRGNFRLTPWQTIVLPDIPDAQVPSVVQTLSSLGLVVGKNPANPASCEAQIVACAGKPGCAASATHTQTDAIALAHHLNQRFVLECPINIHLTGCLKSCAQPSPAEITLLGTAISTNRDGDATVEGYHIYLGDGQQSLKYKLCTVTATDVASTVESLMRLYQRHQKTINESFGEFVRRSEISNGES